MKTSYYNNIISIISLISLIVFSACTSSVKDYTTLEQEPSIFPDYVDVVIPPNIAPLNFHIKNPGTDYHIEIYSEDNQKISLTQTDQNVEIPMNKWEKILSENKGKNMFIDIYVKNEKWEKYKTIKDSIASEEIDSYLVYRLINGAYVSWGKMGIYQRNLENFDESTIFENTSTSIGTCVNCHMFPKNDPKKMHLHFRAEYGGTLIKEDDVIKKINTKTDSTFSAGGYPSWHPNGKLIVYSLNAVRQNLTSDIEKTQDVFDKVSDIALFDVENNTLIGIPKLSTSRRENLPTWSPDGKYMYYISAPGIKKDLSNKTKVKYDLMRVAFDEKTLEFGEIDTVLTSEETGRSITFPVVSPDGKYILFGMTDYGYFPVYHRVADLYIYEIETGEYRELKSNSTSTDSYHSWASSSRWFVFSSKRLDDTYSRPFFSYIDKNGKEHKPFLLPQKNPLFYDKFNENFNRPELITGKVDVNPREIRDAVVSDAQPVNYKLQKDEGVYNTDEDFVDEKGAGELPMH